MHFFLIFLAHCVQNLAKKKTCNVDESAQWAKIGEKYNLCRKLHWLPQRLKSNICRDYLGAGYVFHLQIAMFVATQNIKQIYSVVKNITINNRTVNNLVCTFQVDNAIIYRLHLILLVGYKIVLFLT